MSLKDRIGEVSASDSPRARRARIHQGWWRSFVLNQKQGTHPADERALICSKLPAESAGLSNFISKEIGLLALEAAENHHNSNDKSGIIEINRLKENLLSSQPLCFNFFGIIALDHELGLKVVQSFYPEITGFSGVRFEYAPSPKKSFTNDNSAFDVALDVSTGSEQGIIGIECKYTEDFSATAYSKDRYKEIYASSDNFVWSYEALSSSRFNQLFRNQLIAESLLQSGAKKFVKTALFCAPDDDKAKNTAAEFSQGIRGDFKIIDFMDYISVIQKQEISERQRIETMRLWARYLAHELSDKAALEY